MTLPRFRTAWAHLRYAPVRFVSTVVAIGLGVALAASVLLVSDRIVSVIESSVESVVGRADLRVVANSPVGLDEDLLPRISDAPGVSVAAPVIDVPAHLDGDPTHQVTIWGLDLLNEGALKLYDMQSGHGVNLGDPLVFMSQTDSVIATRSLLTAKNLQLGDKLDVVTPGGVRSLVIRGVFDPRRDQSIGGADVLVMDVYSAQTLFAQQGRFTHVDILVAPGSDANEVAGRLASLVGGMARVEPGAKLQAGIQQMFAGFRLVFLAFSMSGLVLSVLVTFSRASAILAARQWELAVTRAVGATPRIVQREILKEFLLVALLGAAVGLPFGLYLARVVAPRLAATAGFVAGVNVPTIDAPVHAGPLLAAAALGIAATLLGALIPARRAGRVPIANLIGTRGVSAMPETRRAQTGLLVAALLCAVALLVWLEPRTRTAAAGFSALLLTVVAACVLVQPILRAAVPLLTRLFAGLFGGPGRLAALSLRQSVHRSTAIVRLFVIGVAVVVWFSTIARSVEYSLIRTACATRRADLTVGSAFDLGGEMATLSEDVVAELRDVPGVESLSAERALYGSAFGVAAFDAQHFLDPRFAVWDVEGSPLPDAMQRVAAGEALIVSPGFAAYHGVDVGTEVTLDTPSGPLHLPIAAIATGSVYSSKGDVALVRSLYRRYWKDSAVTRVHIAVAPGVKIDWVRRDILRTLGASQPVRILSASELADLYGSRVRQAAVLVQAMSLLVLLVVMLGVADALLVDVLERTRELGTMRALGAPPKSVGLVIVLEGIATSVIGSAAAIALGFALSVILLRRTMPSLLGWSQSVEFNAATCLTAIGLALLAALVGGAVPAWRASQIAPAAALREE